MNGWMYVCMVGWMYVSIDGLMNGWMDETWMETSGSYEHKPCKWAHLQCQKTVYIYIYIYIYMDTHISFYKYADTWFIINHCWIDNYRHWTGLTVCVHKYTSANLLQHNITYYNNRKTSCCQALYASITANDPFALSLLTYFMFSFDLSAMLTLHNEVPVCSKDSSACINEHVHSTLGMVSSCCAIFQRLSTHICIAICVSGRLLWYLYLDVEPWCHFKVIHIHVIVMYNNYWITIYKICCLAGAVLTHSPLTAATQFWYPTSAYEMVIWSPSRTGGFPPGTTVPSHTVTTRTQTSVQRAWLI